ncbi:MAG: galactose-1-phosphate uridylyltransferase [Bacillota bacterium]|nr:galactose-1-phosphate uridylyltransferase [Bacillota bacterium]
MAELRWNPFIKDWVIIAPKRQARTDMPKDKCPFCPGTGRIPGTYDVLSYDNDFPALCQNPQIPLEDSFNTHIRKSAYGKCEVILYSMKHEKSLWQLPVQQIKRLVDLWGQRFITLKKDKKIKYIYIFENRGELVGATISHPHGQIYAYSYIPKKLEMEIESSNEYFNLNHSCLFCDMLANEMRYGKRIVSENEDFCAFIPFFSECPYGIYIASKNHKKNIIQFSDSEKLNLACILKDVTGTLDALFDFKFPYMMCMHQGPVNCDDYGENFHFHVEFYSPLRSKESQKFNASGETGAWAHVNPTKPEEKAEELRNAYIAYMGKASDYEEDGDV